MGTRVCADQDATSRLEQLGVDPEWLRRALLRGDAECRTVSSLAPVGFSGSTRWGRTAEYFREDAVSSGWLQDDARNVARSIHPSGEHCIVVTTGSPGTGVESAKPTTKYPKGSGTASCVEQNYMLDFDADDLRRMGVPPAAEHPMATWLFMFVVEGNVIYSELSLPDAISDDGVIISWVERIILKPIDLGPAAPLEDEGPRQPVDVPVSRR
jgi:hypothetical protein